MKPRILYCGFILMLFVHTAPSLFAQRCKDPMPTHVFRQKLNHLAMQQNDPMRLQLAREILQGSCLLSSQIKEFAMIFTGDYYRFEFCKRAWKHTFDPGNFYDVYDAFTSLSAAFRLHDFVKQNSNIQEPEPTQPVIPPPPRNWYPDMPYPIAAGYQGMAGCQLPIADNDFEIISRTCVSQTNDVNRRREALKIVSSNCLSMSQAMKLATLFQLEGTRLEFMKEIFTKLYDLENYNFGTELFSHIPYKNDWLAFCPGVLEPVVVPPPAEICVVNEAEYTDIKRSISNVSVNSTRLSLAKQIISTKKCFSVQQIDGIMKLFSIESSRLEVALYSYDFCTNRDDYYKLTESLYTTSSKNKLIQFINDRK